MMLMSVTMKQSRPEASVQSKPTEKSTSQLRNECMLENNIIEPSKSEWSSKYILVPNIFWFQNQMVPFDL